MAIRYESIREIIADFQLRSGTALLYEQDGEKCAISYRELGERVLAKAYDLPGYADAVVCDGKPETIIRILADAFAGRDVLLADSDVPPVSLDGAARMLEYRQYGFYQSQSALCFFTSGTTGKPRVVVLPQKALAASAWCGQSMLACGPEDIVYAALPLSHVYGFVCSLLWGLAYGAVNALCRGREKLAEDFAWYQPTIFPTVPAMIDLLAGKGVMNPACRTVLIGGAAAREETVRTLQAEGRRVYLGYGLTETASGIAISQDESDPWALTPCPEAEIRIEEDGEISVETPCMMEGYLGEPEMMDSRLYTGDLGRMDERGRLYILGRKTGADEQAARASWKTGNGKMQ